MAAAELADLVEVAAKGAGAVPAFVPEVEFVSAYYYLAALVVDVAVAPDAVGVAAPVFPVVAAADLVVAAAAVVPEVAAMAHPAAAAAAVD